MELDRISLTIRPRGHWEAIDLGLTLLQTYARSFFPIWFAVVLPIIVVIYFVFLEFSPPWLAASFIWWLKPFYDLVCLHFFSRAVFNELPTIRQTWAALPSLIFSRNALAMLTFRRFDLARSFNLPIAQLEGLTGTARRKRVNLLQKQTRSYAVYLTVIYLHFEWLVYCSLILLFLLFVPDIYVDSIWEQLMESETDTAFTLLIMLFSLIALTIIEPLYVASGFVLYLNRRTHLEGWDIELLFRQIAKRMYSPLMVFGAAIMVSALIFPHSPAFALEQEQAKINIQQVLADPDFSTTETRYRWVYVGEVKSLETPISDGVDFSFLAWLFKTFVVLMEYLIWLVFFLLIIGLLFYYRRYLLMLLHISVKPPLVVEENAAVTLVQHGHHHAHLPLDPAHTAWQWWQRGDTHAALSLLYRAALQQTQRRYSLLIEDGRTEDECVRLVKQAAPVETGNYFAQLTRFWQQLAYAQRVPNDSVIKQLCEDWKLHF
ncbi:DUF4129 domain-containing protein [Thioflexithrix psekupsensis]|uniref:Protein-glutamine gamma-glutamyltransferase-like C-terminal domain-containing protein n=1 Tax=Thioflexithrix psekupsensis TaxID=1570016 RepID=A0A251X918_9GAMM|nr:DUF4129 domain-containing protein [Thioflexithrix psekupsensis]OUD14471.1 hypothetical protein TPSD3_09220 [Thioflexithrix psekupsensis]